MSEPKCNSSSNLQDDGKTKRTSKIPKPRNGVGAKPTEEKVIACLEEKNNNSFLQLYVTKVYFLQDKLKNKDEADLDEDVTELANKISALCHKIKDVESCMFIGKQSVNPQIEFGPAGDVDLITNEHLVKNINRFNCEITNEAESDNICFQNSENANTLNAKTSQLFCPMDFTFENMFQHSANTSDGPKYKTTVHKLPKIVPLDSKDKGSISKVLEMLSFRTEEIMRRISVMDVNIKQLRIFKEAAQTSEICQYCKLFFDELTRQKQEITEIVDTLKGCVDNVPLSFNNFQEQIETLTKGVNTMLEAKTTPIILQNSTTSPIVSDQHLKPTHPLDISNKPVESCSSNFRRPINIINEIHFQNESGLCNNTELEEVEVDSDQIPTSDSPTKDKKVMEKSKSFQEVKKCLSLLKTDEKLGETNDNIEETLEISSEIVNIDEIEVNELFTGTLKTKIMQGEPVNSECRCNCCESLMFSNNCTCSEVKESASKNTFTFEDKKYVPSFYSMRDSPALPKISNKFPKSADSISTKKNLKSSEESLVKERIEEEKEQVSKKSSQNAVIWRKKIDDYDKVNEKKESKCRNNSKDKFELDLNGVEVKQKDLSEQDVVVTNINCCKTEKTKIPIEENIKQTQITVQTPAKKDHSNDISLSKSYKLNIQENWSYDLVNFKNMSNQTADSFKLVTRSDTSTKLDDIKIDKLRSILRMNANSSLLLENCTKGPSAEVNKVSTSCEKDFYKINEKGFESSDYFLRVNENSPLEGENCTRKTNNEYNKDVMSKSKKNFDKSNIKNINSGDTFILIKENRPLEDVDGTRTFKALNNCVTTGIQDDMNKKNISTNDSLMQMNENRPLEVENGTNSFVKDLNNNSTRNKKDINKPQVKNNYSNDSVTRMNDYSPLEVENGTRSTVKDLNNHVSSRNTKDNNKLTEENNFLNDYFIRVNENRPLGVGNGTRRTVKELNNIKTNTKKDMDKFGDNNFYSNCPALEKDVNSPQGSINGTLTSGKGINNDVSIKNNINSRENYYSKRVSNGSNTEKSFSEKSCLCNFCNNKYTSTTDRMFKEQSVDLSVKQKYSNNIFEENFIDKFCSCSDMSSTLSDNTLNESFTKEQINEQNKKILAVEIPKIISEKNVKHLSRRLIKSDGVIYLPKIVPVNIRKIFTNKKTNNVRDYKKYYKTNLEKTYKEIEESKNEQSDTDNYLPEKYLPRNKSRLGFLVPKVFVKKPATPPKKIAQKIFVTINTEKYEKVRAIPENNQACFISHKQIVGTAQNVSSKFRNWAEEVKSGSELYSQCSSDKNSSNVLNNNISPPNSYGYASRMSKNLDVLYNLDTEPCKLKSFNYDSVSLFEQVSEPEYKDSVENCKRNRKDDVPMYEEKINVKPLPSCSSCDADSEQKELNIEQELGNLNLPRGKEHEKYILCLAKDSQDLRRLERLGLRPVDVTRKMLKRDRKQNKRGEGEGIPLELKENIFKSLETAREFNERLGDNEAKDIFDTEKTYSSKNVAEDLDDMMKYFGTHKIKSFENVPRSFYHNPDVYLTKSDPVYFKKKPSLFKKLFRRRKIIS